MSDGGRWVNDTDYIASLPGDDGDLWIATAGTQSAAWRAVIEAEREDRQRWADEEQSAAEQPEATDA